jgi:hypothetical protein
MEWKLNGWLDRLGGTLRCWLIRGAWPIRCLPKDDAADDGRQLRYAYVATYFSEPEAELIYARSLVRILRAAVINVPLIILFGGWLAWRRVDANWRILVVHAIWQILVGVVLGVVAWMLAAAAYRYNDVLYDRRVTNLYNAYQAKARRGDTSS